MEGDRLQYGVLATVSALNVGRRETIEAIGYRFCLKYGGAGANSYVTNLTFLNPI